MPFGIPTAPSSRITKAVTLTAPPALLVMIWPPFVNEGGAAAAPSVLASGLMYMWSLFVASSAPTTITESPTACPESQPIVLVPNWARTPRSYLVLSLGSRRIIKRAPYVVGLMTDRPNVLLKPARPTPLDDAVTPVRSVTL